MLRKVGSKIEISGGDRKWLLLSAVSMRVKKRLDVNCFE